ncbi:MAG: aminodeoxychorismate synthase component I [Planctomycetes bacterium]|nr:aminodeoxychorismate synthase component I [Planctomycetota bacterium]
MHQLKIQSRLIKLPHGWGGVIDAVSVCPYGVVFDSTSGELGTLSHASFGPTEVLVSDDDNLRYFEIRKANLSRVMYLKNPLEIPSEGSALKSFNSVVQSFQQQYELSPHTADGFYGGWAGLLGYDLAGEIENLPKPKKKRNRFPELLAAFYPWTITHNHKTGETTLSAMEGLEGRPGKASDKLDTLEQFFCANFSPKSLPFKLGKPTLSTSKNDYLVSAKKILAHIREGDIYQANLTREVVFRGESYSNQIYQSLRKHNPAPFGGFLDCGEGRYVLSSSPERFISIKDGMIETRPIKGTRARSSDPVEDARIKEELANSEKDRAELTMIVDLERNDLGRICKPGTIKVTELMQVQTYETVHHLEATITGELRDDVTVEDYIRAPFPGGSITGAPKKRAMEIIHELEPVRRGPYTGSMFYLTPCGHFESNILIRTINVEPSRVSYHVGGGIVADSDPEAEWQETLDKAAALEATLKEFTGA